MKKQRKVPNRFRVGKEMWNEWSETEKELFNDYYDWMKSFDQRQMTHPKAQPMPKKHWETLSWNAAWMATCTLHEIVHQRIVKLLEENEK